MSAMSLQVFDQPMCCPTGVCGAELDPALVQFAADLEWLKANGIAVRRFNPAQEPSAFVTHSIVRGALQAQGARCLPLILWGDAVVASGKFPERTVLARAVGLPVADGISI